MKERPILFSAPMVRAIIEGRKTQTRRIINERSFKIFEDAAMLGEMSHGIFDSGKLQKNDLSYMQMYCPYGEPGEKLWVRETWATGKYLDGISPSSIAEKANDAGYTNGKLADLWYYADDSYFQFGSSPHMFGDRGKCRPSIHMPRWASRIDLEIANVRVERLQDISEDDAIAEGCDNSKSEAAINIGWYEKPVKSFKRLWESINGSGSWDQNPWVWVVEFKRI